MAQDVAIEKILAALAATWDGSQPPATPRRRVDVALLNVSVRGSAGQ
jgi:hypothetical protein